MLAHLVAGLVTGLGLIVAIGAQNAFVLRQGLARDQVGIIVAICALSDLLLILAGTAGLGALIGSHPTALTALKWVGAAYLVWFGVRSLLTARHASALAASPARSRGSVVATTLALTFLNPHVYLDTVLMLGNLANQHGATGRWWFAGGASIASILWFSGLGFGARALSGPLGRPRTWQVLDLVIGLVMFTLAVVLLSS
jgi:L-lysine exporter family protein LysE/ArgO